ncbi:hypothetical protein ASALC70_01082 [Alcanivorax sp. ALC70]|nr:hypothetical protein ASALC70_01082 [Alcanivorax sp. ALC70]
MRASATWVEVTRLPTLISRGSTTPEKRMNSVPWLIRICFSPRTRRLPLPRISSTVTVMVPVKVLRAWEPPPPWKVFSPARSKP